MNEFSYFCYRDLKSFIPSYPKRHATHTRSGIPCEYYTVPRTIHTQPRGYTNYTYKYDISESGQIIRIGLRYPRYESEGQIITETILTFDGIYSEAFLLELYNDFTNPWKAWDLLKRKYPFSNNPSRDALDLLRPFGTKNKLLPNYPTCITDLWFIQAVYKDTRLTFCLDCSFGVTQLFDILVGENDYVKMTDKLRQSIFEGIPHICLNANQLLYNTLHTAFPDAKFVFDAFQFPIFLNRTSQLLDSYCRDGAYDYRNAIIDCFTELLTHNRNNEKQGRIKGAIEEIYDTFKYMLNIDALSDEFIAEIKSFLLDIGTILADDPRFITRFSERRCFHSFIPYELQQFFVEQISSRHKHHGYTPERLAFIMLARIQDINYGRYPVQNYKKVNISSMQGAAHFQHTLTTTNTTASTTTSQSINQTAALEALLQEMLSF